MPLTREQIRKSVLGRLGSSHRKVELNNEDFDQCTDDSLRKIKGYMFKRSPITAQNLTEKALIDVDADIADVIRVDFNRTTDPYYNMNVFQLEYMIKTTPGVSRTSTGPGEIERLYQFRELWEYVTARQPGWFFDYDNHQLIVFVPATSYDIMYWVIRPHTLETIPADYEDLFIRIVEAYSRQRLGDIRNRYGSSIPGPQGDIQHDGAEQLQRAEQMFEKLNEELASIKAANLSTFISG